MIINGKHVEPSKELLELVARQNEERPIGSLATALPTGALREPIKPAHTATRADLEAVYAARRTGTINPSKPPDDPTEEEIAF